MSAALAAAGLLGLPMLVRPALPLFGRLLEGWPAAVGLASGSLVCLWLAWATFRLRRSGWWATSVFLAALGVSTSWTLLAVDPAEIYRLMGYREESLDLVRAGGGTMRLLLLTSSVALTAIGIGYMLAIRRHFTR
jgi:hypothetical protein